SVEALEVDLAERAGRGALCGCDGPRERDPRLRKQILAVVQGSWLGVVVVVPDQALAAAEGEGRAAENEHDGCRGGENEHHEASAHRCLLSFRGRVEPYGPLVRRR